MAAVRWIPGLDGGRLLVIGLAVSAVGLAALGVLSAGAGSGRLIPGLVVLGIGYGATNAALGVLVASVIIFAVGFPVAFYGARYNIDLDLIARGSGFGYYGSIITTIIFAGFTCIFFALEGAIMAQGLEMAAGVPLPIGYAISTVVVVPIVIFGMRALERLHFWTTPLWLVLAPVPLAWGVISRPRHLTRC